MTPSDLGPAANSMENILEVADVSSSYGRSIALREVSFKVRRGGKTLLLGPNGAGKSTLVKTIVGIHKFTGRITVDGLDVVKAGSKARDRMGYVPQFSAFYDSLTVEQEAKLLATVKGATQGSVSEKLEAVGLSKARGKTIGSLSGGMKQRFALAMALLTDPPLLIFDEPLTSIDLRGQLRFLELVKSLSSNGTSFLIATHLSGLGDFADDAVVLHRGRLVAQGAPADLLAQMNAEETLYLKPKAGMEEAVISVVEASQGRVVNATSVPIVVSVPLASKFALLRRLMADGDLLEDLSMEPMKIESSYSRLLLKKKDGNLDRS